MPIAFACESCGRRYQVDDALAGKKGKCKACGQPLLIPAARQAAPASPPPTDREPARARPIATERTGPDASPSPAGPAQGEGRQPRRSFLLALTGVGVLVVAALAVPFLYPSAGGGAAEPGPVVSVPPEAPPGPAPVAATAPAVPAAPAPAPGPGTAVAVTPANVATPPANVATPPANVATPPATPAPVVAATPDALLAKVAEARRQLEADQNGDRYAELGPAFDAALRAAAPALTEVAVGTAERPSRLTRVELNGRRLGFDALRFKAPADGPRLDMKWEFIMPAVDNERGRAMEAWYIMPLKGDMVGFSHYHRGANEPVEGVDLPRKYHVVQELEGGEIRPGNEYLIWFTFEAGSPAVPTYVKIDLVPPDPEVVSRIRATEAARRRTFELPDSAHGLGASADGRRALMAAGASLYSGDIESGQVRKCWDGQGRDVRSVAFSPDGTLAAVGCGNGTILLVDVEAGKEVRRCKGHSAGLRCLAFLPDGKQLVSGAEDRTARLWDVATGKEVRKFEGHTDQVLCLAVSPDGRRLATGPSVEDKVARVWDVATGKLIARLEGNAEAVYALAFSPDGKAVLTGGEDTTLRFYDAASGRPIRRFKPDFGSRLHAASFLPDGRVIASGEGHFVTFWSSASGRLLDAYEGPFGGTHLIASAPGNRMLTSSADRTVRVWTLPPFDAAAAAAPTKADLAYLRSVVDDLEATTPDELGELTHLALNARTDDEGLAHLARLRNLETLSIAGAPKVRGAGLARLKGLTRLRSLDLSHTGIGDTGLAHLAPLTRLERLSLGDTRVTNAGIAHLRGLTNLKRLDLQNDAVTDVALRTLVDLPNLETLDLEGTKVGDDGLSLIRRFKKLSTLTLGATRVTETAAEALRKALPKLNVEL